MKISNKVQVTSNKLKQSGQVIVILLLVMVIALALGLAVVGRSITDISTSTKTEDSARAYLAAEAGIEKALVAAAQSGPLPLSLGNMASASVNWSRLLPSSNRALEYPPYGRESFGHFWLANPDTLSEYYGSPSQGRTDSFELYFGVAKDYTASATELANQPAVEVHVVSKKGQSYESKKFYFDSYNGTAPGRDNNGFAGCSAREIAGIAIQTNNYTENRLFYCRAVVNFRSVADQGNVYPVLARVRMLYSSSSHPVALKPSVGSLPPQVSLYNSTGVAGNTSREIEVFQQRSVVPYMFDYVLFSAGELKK